MRAIALLLSLLAALSAAPADAQDFYRGKTVTIVVPIGPGGAYDTYARLVARHLGKQLPGNPAIVAVNMPGGAGVIASNYVYNVSPRDGTTLTIITSGFASEQVVGNQAIKYDARRFIAIGRLLDTISTVVVWHTSPIKRLEDAYTHDVLMAESTAVQLTSVRLLAMNRYLGTRFKLVTGYPSASDFFLAMERGETDGGSTTYIGVLQLRGADIAAGRMKVLVQFSGKRGADMPDIPALGELSDKPEVRQVFNFLDSNDEIGRSLFTTPDVPAERVALLRDGFQRMLADPDFRQEAEARKLPLAPLSGEELEALVQGTFGISDAALATVKELMQP